ncbi:RNA polymerase sigma factor [Amphritea sp. HPY]|uniref:RNA polymerase sigma factor n=1 Tax=Amphritea sp. HPY TaxID=3421652 RepID=UPI003D7DEAE2
MSSETLGSETLGSDTLSSAALSSKAWKKQIETLLGQVRLKHQPAFEKLYQLTSGKLYALILKMIPDPELAADALQESYTKIWRQADRYRSDLGEDWAWSWMCQLTRNTAIDRIRQTVRRQETQFEEGLLEHTVDQDSFLDERRDLNRCLQSIKQEPRQAIMLTYVYGFSNAELAEKLNTPLGTLKSWIRRGLKELQQCLQS